MTKSRRHLESAVLPHLDAGFNLARWLLGDDHDARDAVQNASERALRYIDSLKGDDGKSWFLGIIRNTCFTALAQRGGRRQDVDVDELLGGPAELTVLGGAADEPDAMLQKRMTRDAVNSALRGMPPLFREVLILREMEDLSYSEIADIIGTPIGTVMSRLARARSMFRIYFEAQGTRANHG